MQVYSFDVFDTVLTRIFARPEDVFRFVQKTVQTREQLPEVLRWDFVSARIWTEFKCRRLNTFDDIPLCKIYELLGCDFGLSNSDLLWLMEQELQVEQKSIVPIKAMVNRINQLRSAGNQILFLSDMYLPQAFIRDRLEEHGAFDAADRLYVSGELGFTKGSGKLFQHVLEHEQLKPVQLIHCGDNPVSDIAVPFKMGIRLDKECLQRFGKQRCFAAGIISKVYYAIRVLQARIIIGLKSVA
jgi:predicted HAD superfamily hydrolase